MESQANDYPNGMMNFILDGGMDCPRSSDGRDMSRTDMSVL